MKNSQILCLIVFMFLSNNIVTGLKCYQCQYTEEEAMEEKIFKYLKYDQFNGSLSECESSPGEDTLDDIKYEEDDYMTSTTLLEETTTESPEGSNNSTEEADGDVLNNRGMQPMAEEKDDVVQYEYCVYFKGYTKDEKKRVVVRGGFKSLEGGQDQKLVTKEFEKYPVENSYWVKFFENIPKDMTGSELYMCKSNGCNEATSLLRQFNTISYTCLSITCLIFSRFYNIY